MRITIITDALTAPLYTPRVRFLNKELQKRGHQVVWYTERYKEIPEELRPQNLVEIDYYKGRFHGIKGVMSLLFDHKNRFFEREICAKAEKSDIVFCSTFHTFGLRAAAALAERDKARLHIDLRDIAEQTPLNSYSNPIFRAFGLQKIYRQINIRKRNRILAKADNITSVSKFHKQILGKVNPNTHIIYNGYDQEIFKPEHKQREGQFRIVYTGRWYGREMQEPYQLFETLSRVRDLDIKMVFYTGEEKHQELRALAKEYGVEQMVEINGYTANSEIPSILNSADMSVILTSPKNRGVLTTKFFEAIGTETPVLCSPSDQGELAETIEATDSGIAAQSAEEAERFIRELHAGTRHLTFDAEQYSRQRQTERLMQIMGIR